jgi:hypothetical protein
LTWDGVRDVVDDAIATLVLPGLARVGVDVTAALDLKLIED